MNADPAAADWSLAHPKQRILVRVFCPLPEEPHRVAELQDTQWGLLLKVYQRETRPRRESEPVGPPDDLSHRLASPAVQYLEAERRARKQYLKARGEVPAWDRSSRFQPYSADDLPDDWHRTMICRCDQGLLTGQMINSALARARHAKRAVFIRFETETR